jgi:hypothetical protein
MQNLLLLSVLLLSAAWAAAQDYPSQKGRDQTNSGQTTSTSTQTTTVQGCLSSSNGNYILTGNKGNTYQLRGDTSKLSAHVGHEVQIKGTPTSASSSAGGTAGAPAGSTMGQPGGSSQKLDVSSVKHVSKGCPSSSPR